MNDIIHIIWKNVLIWWCYLNSKTWDAWFLGAFLAPLAASLVDPVISSASKGISGRRVRRSGKRYINKNFLVPLHPKRNMKITKYFNY